MFDPTKRFDENQFINELLFDIRESIVCENCRRQFKNLCQNKRPSVLYCFHFRPRKGICKFVKCRWRGSGKLPCRRIRKDKCFLLPSFGFNKPLGISQIRIDPFRIRTLPNF